MNEPPCMGSLALALRGHTRKLAKVYRYFEWRLATLPPYTANLCPLSVLVELACFREDFGESIGELVETLLRSAVRKRTTEHLDGMLSEQQGIDDTVQTAPRRGVRSFRLWRKMPGLRSGQMKLPLQIGSSNV